MDSRNALILTPTFLESRTTSEPSTPRIDQTTFIDELRHAAAVAPLLTRDRPTLSVLTGAQAGMVVRMSERGIVIGRGEDADIRIADAWLSRHHARVVWAAEAAHVEDLASMNGTFVGQEHVVGSRRLDSGDHVRLGRDVVLRFGMLDALEEQSALRLYEASVRDATTAAYNRRHFDERLDAELLLATRHHSAISVLLFDLDEFKRINDGFGHHVGDAVLRVVSASVQRILHPDDLLARYGGDEFAVLVRNLSPRNVEILGDRVRRLVESLPLAALGTDFRVTVSVGAACAASDESHTASALVATADRAMYAAKASGRNRVVSSVPENPLAPSS